MMKLPVLVSDATYIWYIPELYNFKTLHILQCYCIVCTYVHIFLYVATI